MHVDTFPALDCLVPGESDWRALPNCWRHLRDTNADCESGTGEEREAKTAVLQCEDPDVE